MRFMALYQIQATICSPFVALCPLKKEALKGDLGWPRLRRLSAGQCRSQWLGRQAIHRPSATGRTGPGTLSHDTSCAITIAANMICIYIYIHAYIMYVCICICMYICICLDRRVCVYIHIYVCAHISHAPLSPLMISA